MENRPLLFSVSGMTCSSCVSKVSKTLKEFHPELDFQISLENSQLLVFNGEELGIDRQALQKSVENAGYKIHWQQTNKKKSYLQQWSISSLIGSLLTAPLFVGHFVLGLSEKPGFHYTEFLLCTLLQLLVGSRFFAGFLRQLWQGKSNMDTLVFIGSGCAYFYSCYLLFIVGSEGAHLYFFESASIVTFVSIGHWMESRLTQKAGSEIEKLLEMRPRKAHRLVGDQSETVSVHQLDVGDLVKIYPGDKVPIDAVIVDGEASFDESALTGESKAVFKNKGDEIFETALCLDGSLTARVNKKSRETAFAKIVSKLNELRFTQSKITRRVDLISSIFVPTVLVIAVAGGLLWYEQAERMIVFSGYLEPHLWPRFLEDTLESMALMVAVSVLIVACPCAMGLATPAALMAVSSLASKKGILIRNAQSIENSAKIDTIFLDKTGTLSTGKPEVVEENWSSAENQKLFSAALHTLAKNSKHPSSRALIHKSQNVVESQLSEIQEFPGKGLSAKSSDGKSFRLGSPRWIDPEHGNEDSVLFEVDAKVLARFKLSDALRPDAREFVDSIKKNHKVCILSGDKKEEAMEKGRELGIPGDQIFYELLPEDKVQLIESHQAQGKKVAFVGDGINDAPAMQAATLGITLSHASDIAKQSADMILLRDNLKDVTSCFQIAHLGLRCIKQNLFWAFFYNSLMIPLAFFAFLHPALCALAMGLSDVFVLGNSFRLARSRVD